MRLRRIEDEQEARTCLAQVARSGEEIGAWARARGIDGRSLRAWSLNLARRVGTKKRRAERTVMRRSQGAALVELVPAPVARDVSRYVVRVGAVALEFGEDFDEATLRRAIAALRSC